MARILVVDDEGPVRKLLGRIVSQLGHHVTLAGNADEAESGQLAATAPSSWC